MKYNIALTLMILTSLSARAQNVGPGSYAPNLVPNPNPLNYLPNFYNRTTQPLSPYLNLLRGGNLGVNYYYGVRPGTPAGGVNVFGQPPAYQPFIGTLAGGFIPQAAEPSDLGMAIDTGSKPVVLRSPSHPVIYGNSFGNHGGFSSVYANSRNNPGNYGGLQQQPPRGVGTVPPRK